MSFPSQPFADPAGYFTAYAAQLAHAAASVAPEAIAAAARLMTEAMKRDAHIYVCGNGGSAAIANHLVCDCVKSVQTDTVLRPRVHSLSSNVPFLTAIANDLAYADAFSYQLKSYGRKGDLLLTISSSGDSENIVRDVQTAHELSMDSIAFTGFAGGRSRELASVSLHVNADNYGVIEDVHQSLMHALAQYIRQAHMPAELVAARKF